MPKREGNYIYVKVSGLSINGKRLPDIEYERTEHSDGRITERGLPAGMKPRPSLPELLGQAENVDRVRWCWTAGNLAHAYLGKAGLTGDRVKTLCGRELDLVANFAGEGQPDLSESCVTCRKAAASGIETRANR